MNWDREIEVNGRSKKLFISIGEIQSILMTALSRDEIEEFAGELIKWCELTPTPSSLLE